MVRELDISPQSQSAGVKAGISPRLINEGLERPAQPAFVAEGACRPVVDGRWPRPPRSLGRPEERPSPDGL